MSTSRDSARIVALYFPQFHPIPENDAWWGEGFTDWVNIRKAQPQFAGHRQPRVPRDGEYVQSDPAVIRRQVAQAKEHGVSAFCHYHYWFDGKQMLETPTNRFLAMKDLDIEFCLSWANENWSRRWDGKDHHILQLQTHPPTTSSWGRHFEYLITAWTDPRALRVDGKPVFLIYRPEKIEQFGSMLDYFRSRARKHGIEDMHFVGVVPYKPHRWEWLRHLDAIFLFQPFVATYSLQEELPTPRWEQKLNQLDRYLPNGVAAKIKELFNSARGPTLIDYDRVWQRIIDYKVDRAITSYEGAFVDWDNTARYGRRAKVYTGASPERFEHWMRLLVEKVNRRGRKDDLIFVNAGRRANKLHEGRDSRVAGG